MSAGRAHNRRDPSNPSSSLSWESEIGGKTAAKERRDLVLGSCRRLRKHFDYATGFWLKCPVTIAASEGSEPGIVAEAVKVIRDDYRAQLEEKTESGEGLDMVTAGARLIDPGEILLGDEDCRYLERSGVLFLSAMAGIGKSTFLLQAIGFWSAGLPAFGLPPMQPLRIILFQAENPPNDMTALCSQALQNHSHEQLAMVRANTRLFYCPGTTGKDFLEKVEREAERFHPDLICIDPLSSFAPGDLCRPEIVQEFCRKGLNGLAVKYRAGLPILHHTPKPPRQVDNRRQADYTIQYAGAGSADLVANWPRAVLTLKASARGQFVLHAAKRRPPWKHPDGSQAYELGLAHSDSGLWIEREISQAEASGKLPPIPLETLFPAILKIVEDRLEVPKTALQSLLREATGCTRDASRDAVELCLSEIPPRITLRKRKGKGGGWNVVPAEPQQELRDLEK